MDQEEWISPADAAHLMSKQAGYKITPDDVKQMRRRGVLKLVKKINDRISLYNRGEILNTAPPKKRNPESIL